mgnify:FL=1
MKYGKILLKQDRQLLQPNVKDIEKRNLAMK